MENDKMKKMIAASFEHSLELQSAESSLEDFINHYMAALLVGNEVKAERERQSCMSAFEAVLDKKQEATKAMLRRARDSL